MEDVTDRPADRAAEELAKVLGDDARFYLVIIERGGNVHKLTTIRDPGARVELLERMLEREEQAEKEAGS